jgi:hypothetical protein
MMQQFQSVGQIHGEPYRRPRKASPWVNDDVLLGLSIWWVRMTHPEASDISTEVAMTFDGLQRDLQ